jgi:hypothetical protein
MFCFSLQFTMDVGIKGGVSVRGEKGFFTGQVNTIS